MRIVLCVPIFGDNKEVNNTCL